ncbi:hypothetical protein F3Y22_tig00111715pilonHSYRG00122 [Hibiscus syriacus]|uniref:RNase H type-1 domain-containing protein n=1 Tax=Hibiscus syriacus TaxID=106335 RepID=A0A6A2XFY2_HIBSY|nr:hypothetical protein F3Y22_tig00111715pilonHSYRG00122 [Hibiscus syriacus]
MVKANFDASFSQENNYTWSGVIIRNAGGLILRACRRKIERITSAFVTEVVVTIHAIQLSLDLRIIHVVIEGDSRSVVRRSTSMNPDWSEIDI